MNLKKIQRTAAAAEDARETCNRMEQLFSYDTSAEQQQKRPGTERLDRCDVNIVIEGPAVHARIQRLTREEINEIHRVLLSVCTAREQKYLDELKEEL